MIYQRSKLSMAGLIIALALFSGVSLFTTKTASAQSISSNSILLPFIANGAAADVSTGPFSVEEFAEVQEVAAEQEISADDELGALGAYGWTYWNGLSTSVKGIPLYIPGGQLAHLIEGKGFRIKTDGANFGTWGNLCDSSVRFTYGNGSHELKSSVRWGCKNAAQWKYRLNWDAPRGDACAELWAKNWSVLVAKQCHYVHG